MKNRWEELQEKNREVFYYDGEKFVDYLPKDPVYIIHINPKALAVGGKYSIAISNPKTDVYLRKGETASIINAPIATAIAGAGGIAHAESELNVYEYDATNV